MSDLPKCPECDSEYAYEVQDLFNCPDCGHEWSGVGTTDSAENQSTIKDAVGNTLQDGDTITVIKDLKVKGASQPLNPSFLLAIITPCKSTKALLKALQKRYMRTSLRTGVWAVFQSMPSAV